MGSSRLIRCDDSYVLNCVSYSSSVTLSERSQVLDVTPGVLFLSTYWSFHVCAGFRSDEIEGKDNFFSFVLHLFKR